MIVEFSFYDLLRLLDEDISQDEAMQMLAMFGTPPEKPAGDTMRVEVFPNRPDLLMVEGVSRALKGILGSERGFRLYSAAPATQTANIDPSVGGIRPFASFAIVRSVVLDDQTVASLMQVQEKLHQTHGRKRRKVAIGVHDMARLRFPITYAGVEPGRISFVPLEGAQAMTADEILSKNPKGRDYAHLIAGKPLYPLIFDSVGTVLSMPPIINGAATRVTPRTKNLLIDVTGEDQEAVDKACTIIATGLYERGAQIELVRSGGRVTPDLSPRRMSLSAAYCRKLLGEDLTMEDISDALLKMRFSVEENGGDESLDVLVPPYRTDCMHQMDLVEDVAIGRGYATFEPQIPALPTIGREHPTIQHSNKGKGAMVGLGYQEAFTFVMTNPAKLFERMASPPRPVAEVSNPKTEDFTIMRDLLTPSLVALLSINKQNSYPQRVFETGDVVILDDSADVKCRTLRRLAAVNSAGTLEETKGHLEYLLSQLGLGKAEFRPCDLPHYLAGRQAEIVVASGGKAIGTIGELHPHVLENHGIDQPSVAFEIDLE